jgi:hypothetical protein
MDRNRCPLSTERGTSPGKEVGPVPRLAICKADDGEVLLLHCNRSWVAVGTVAYPSVSAAKQRAHRVYRGLSSRWIHTETTKAQAERYRRKLWAGRECSFCGKRPDQVQRMFSVKRARICDVCVAEFHGSMRDTAGAGRGA